MSDRSLAARRIVVGGGTGDVGVDIVAALLKAGAEVIVPARSSHKAETLRQSLPDAARLTVIEGFPTDEAGVAQLRQAVGAIDGAVASLGSWRHAGTLTAMKLDEWTQAVAGNLTAHLMFAQAVVPAIVPGGQYLMVNGAAALHPVPNSAHVSIMAAAQVMFGRALMAENPGLLVHTLMLNSIIATRARATPDPAWLTSDNVGAMAAWIFGPEGRMTAGSTITLSGDQPIPGSRR